MPISRERFDKEGVPSLDLPVFEFLKKHPRNAYTATEIGAATGLIRGNTFQEDIVGVMLILQQVKGKHVEARVCDDKLYFMWTEKP